MARVSYRKLKAGDLLSIPVAEDRIAVGQVIEPGAEMYLCVYEPLYPLGERIPSLAGTEIALLGRTTDELLWHGRWSISGTQPLPADIPKPYYVILTPAGLTLRSFEGHEVRPADETDLAFYGRHFSVSNIKFTKVMRHLHGLEPYTDDYSKITYTSCEARAALRGRDVPV